MTPPYSPFPPYADWTTLLQSFTYRVRSPGFGTGKPLIIGDSLINQCPYVAACGTWMNSFGVNGARAHDLLVYIDIILSIAQPSDVVLAIGKNDCATSTTEGGLASDHLTWGSWTQDYYYLAEYVKSQVPGIALVDIPPTEATVQSGLAAYNNPAKRAQWNSYIAACASAFGCALIDTSSMGTVGGYLPPGSTADGVHPIDAEQAVWWGQIKSGLIAAISMRGASCSTYPIPVIP